MIKGTGGTVSVKQGRFPRPSLTMTTMQSTLLTFMEGAATTERVTPPFGTSLHASSTTGRRCLDFATCVEMLKTIVVF